MSFGLWIGLFYLPDFLWISLLVIGLLYLETWKTVCTPLISQGSRTLGFPTDLENRIFLTLSTLAPSPGQNLFADIVRIGSALFSNSKNNFSGSIFSEQILSSLNLSCKIASELNQLDQHLAVISKHISVSPTDKKLLKLMENYENHRDKLMQMLLELLSALAIINVQKYTIGDSALQELEGIIKELEEESKIQLEAEEEVKKYLEEAVPC